MRRIGKKSVLSGKGALVIVMTFLFAACLLYFSIQNYDIVPLPILHSDDTAEAAQAVMPEEWADNLLSIELPVFSQTTKLGETPASLTDPDWLIEGEQADQASGSTQLSPIVQTADGPVIMFYSTHSNESYRKADGQVYKELVNSNTLNTNYNILRVNRELSTLLAETYNLPLYFCSTDHEMGKYYSTSYERSLNSITEAMEEYPTLRVFFDIHRDAANEGRENDVVMVEGKACARIMFVVGTGEGKTGAGFKVKPNWESNLAFAKLLTNEINRIAPGLCKDVRINTGRYNQHVSDTALAIEVGHNQNTLEEALNAVPYLALAINNVLTEELDIKPVSVP